MQVRAAAARKAGEPLSLETVELDGRVEVLGRDGDEVGTAYDLCVAGHGCMLSPIVALSRRVAR